MPSKKTTISHRRDFYTFVSVLALVDGEGHFHLVDFDRARLRRGQRWKVPNLRRLRRSLVKQRGLDPALHFRDGHFRSLLDAYRSGPYPSWPTSAR